MENFDDELMETPSNLVFDIEKNVTEAFFQFDEDEPIQITIFQGKKFTLELQKTGIENNVSSIIFSDGKGKTFKLFVK